MSRKALLVGVNEYGDAGINNLAGCVNDVKDMRALLINHFDFDPDDIRTLLDKRATMCNIFDRLRWLVDGAQPGDVMVFHFSGHGSQIRDRDGDELQDGLDEILCPHDMDFDGVYITDDYLCEMFSEVPKGATLEVVLDCCHSGTGTRDLSFASHHRSIRERLGMEKHPAKIRYIAPPEDIAMRSRATEGFKPRKIGGMRENLWAGCKDYQTSADAYIDGDYHGAFTYHLVEALKSGSTIRSEIIGRVQEWLSSGGYDQVPQLESANQGEPIFA